MVGWPPHRSVYWRTICRPIIIRQNCPQSVAPRLIELCFQTAGVWELGVQSRMGLAAAYSPNLVLTGASAELMAACMPSSLPTRFMELSMPRFWTRKAIATCVSLATRRWRCRMPLNAAALKALQDVISADAAASGLSHATRLTHDVLSGCLCKTNFNALRL